ncbi:hypothetical protein OPU71_08625 [Niveibacterium sp. 24ML]|uniref:hypothetical protein n=1 Tax=Niveibacterium sp. 24ML TaxID=2985512 RepID=UPI00226F029A|nr:hypothetical protein [Niveibacterium sp. 24ML]MCX9156186.1 hypothetical protein [Niveibacterium sp. 24ML]
MSKNILLVMLEFDNWTQARAWSYTGAYAFHDGLIENGHRCTLLPALWGRDPGAADSYLHRAPASLSQAVFSVRSARRGAPTPENWHVVPP